MGKIDFLQNRNKKLGDTVLNPFNKIKNVDKIYKK